jgi:hypothetical protein
MVEITCDNGKIFSTFVSGSNHAIVWERNLKTRFHGSLWLETLDVRAVGSDTDYAQTVVEGALAWVLSPGQYEAVSHAASSGRGSSGFMQSSFGGRSSLGGPARAFLASSSFKIARPWSSFHVASAKPTKTGRTTTRNTGTIDKNEEVTSSGFGGGNRPGALFEGSGLRLEDGRMSSGVTDTPVAGGSASGGGAVGATGMVESGGASLSSSILQSNVRENHPVRVVFQEYADRSEEIPQGIVCSKTPGQKQDFYTAKGGRIKRFNCGWPALGKVKNNESEIEGRRNGQILGLQRRASLRKRQMLVQEGSGTGGNNSLRDGQSRGICLQILQAAGNVHWAVLREEIPNRGGRSVYTRAFCAAQSRLV